MQPNIRPFAEDKKICIIVPVYNAEKYLGYCLNSIMSQSYTNWSAILVDDGSSDSSLEICRRYEALDSRFKVIAKPNGGVSSARNAGLAAAEGDYLEFADSDDCLALDALEKQARLAAEYQSQLVVMNTMVIDFNDPDGGRLELTSNWLGQSPCALNAEEFRGRLMRLIWFTALLEGPCMKLYDLKLWKKLGLRFPEDLSLGEDFVTNMKYYAACNGAVFLNECGYYYNQYMGSGSLTEKYRADLFEIKMYLMEELERNLGGREKLSPEERDAFDCYCASSGLVCVEKAALTGGMDQQRLAARIKEMFSHALFAKCVAAATYVPERLSACVAMAGRGEYDMIARYIAEDRYNKDQEAAKRAAEEAAKKSAEAPVKVETAPVKPRPAPPENRSGVINRGLRKAMRVIRPAFGNGGMGERLSRWEKELAQTGIKNTFRSHAYAKRRVSNFTFEIKTQELKKYVGDRNRVIEDRIRKNSAQVARVEDNVRKTAQVFEDRLSAAQTAIDDVRSDIADVNQAAGAMTAELRHELENVAYAVHVTDEHVRETRGAATETAGRVHEIEKKLDAADEALRRLNARVAEAQQDINDYVWTTEQRMMRYAYQRDVNELRQRKKALMLATAEHANIGDAAITLAEQEYLLKSFPEYYQVEISTYEFKGKEAYLHAILNPEDIIFINGGGNIGDTYPEEEELHRRIVSEFPNNRIIIFPQTIGFADLSGEELKKSARVYCAHKELALFVRGEKSLNFVREHFPGVRACLMPDMAHILRTDYAMQRKGALLCLRGDGEAKLDATARDAIEHIALRRAGSFERSSNIHTEDVSRDIRGITVRRELMRFAGSSVVVTDRLHGMIFSAVTGTPCVVLSSFNHKIGEYYDAFFGDSNAVFFIGDDMDKLDAAVEKALQVKKAVYPVFERDYYAVIRKFAMEK